MMKAGTRWVVPLFLAVIFLASCETTDKMTAGMQKAADKVTEKGQAMSDKNRVKIDESRAAIAKSKEEITPEQEYYIGREVASKILGKYKLYQNSTATEYVTRYARQ